MRRTLLALVVTLLAPPAVAADIRIEDSWARASLGQARNGAAYMTIHTIGPQPDRLVAASSPVADKVGSPAVLQPGGLHVMLLDLRAPLQAGQSFPVTLRFERAGEVQVHVEIRAARGPSPHRH
jgi:copper(I)-binding protein